MPFPDISSTLAVSAHMYICQNAESSNYQFVKCQTLKPYMLTQNIMRHYWDETPDINRNPFQRDTRIDCDKTFSTSSVSYDDSLKTTVRPDVCEDVMSHINAELTADGYTRNAINEVDLINLNPLVSRV